MVVVGVLLWRVRRCSGPVCERVRVIRITQAAVGVVLQTARAVVLQQLVTLTVQRALARLALVTVQSGRPRVLS